MLQDILSLLRANDGRALSKEAISSQIGVSPGVLDQMLLTLVRRGRLVEVDGACDECSTCPLDNFCSAAPSIAQVGYTLAQPDPSHVRNAS